MRGRPTVTLTTQSTVLDAPRGDQLTAQSNLLPLTQLGTTAPGANVQAAMRSWLGLDDTKESDNGSQDQRLRLVPKD